MPLPVEVVLAVASERCEVPGTTREVKARMMTMTPAKGRAVAVDYRSDSKGMSQIIAITWNGQRRLGSCRTRTMKSRSPREVLAAARGVRKPSGVEVRTVWMRFSKMNSRRIHSNLRLAVVGG